MNFFDVMTAETTQQIDSEADSIRKHLNILLNTRQGSVAHVPEYGLPDMTELYAQLPSSMGVLVMAIEDCVREFEPRLGQLTVSLQAEQDSEMVVGLLIEGVIETQGRQRFSTAFMSSGLAKVS